MQFYAFVYGRLAGKQDNFFSHLKHYTLDQRVQPKPFALKGSQTTYKCFNACL